MIRTRAVDVIPRVFDPLPEAKLSMCTVWSLGWQIRRKGSRGGPDGLANDVYHPLDHYRIVALRHHPDQRLGSGLADDEAPFALQLSLRGGDALANTVGLERLAAAAEAHILQELRQRFELVQQCARGRLGLDQRGQHLKPRN